MVNAVTGNDLTLTTSPTAPLGGDLNIESANVGNDIFLTVDGKLTQNNVGSLAPNTITVNNNTVMDVEGTVTLTSAGNDFGANTTGTVEIDAEGQTDITDVNAIIFADVDVGNATAASDFNVIAGDTITQTAAGHVVVEGQTDMASVNGITLDNTINDFVGDVSARNTTSGNITLRDANDINLGDTVNGNGGVVNSAVGGNIAVTTEDGDIVINNIAGYSVDSANDVTFTAKNNPTTVGDNGNVVQLGQAIAVSLNGDAQTVANAGLDTTSTKATGTLTMTTDGSVGGVKGADYIVTEAGTYVVTAGGDVDVVGLNGMDVTGITAGGNADLYTDGTITTKNNGGNITTGGDVTVTAADYDRTVDMTMNGSIITVNNIEGQPAKNAPFDLHGGNEHPEVTATRNQVTVFADGRYVGGERKNFNRLWTLEAFQVLMPSIDVNYTVDDEGTITETTEGEE
ncbi:MAG: hypothetical protein II823_08120 [Kiritimatiellae bacterium]|nr:hypothetical protein [Kiritimatiellia bacterium]